MGKININGVETLGSLRLNGREYAFGVQGNNLDYYERQSNEFGINYVAPKKDYTLEGNAGTSLTKLNERLFMQHVADELKRDIKIGKLKGLKEISDSINKMQEVFDEEGPDKLKQLFKGDPKNIDEELLVSNSKKLISYLDSKRKAKDIKVSDFDFIDGGVDNTFTVNMPKQEFKKSFEPTKKIDDSFEVLSPTIIVDKLDNVSRKEIIAETKKAEPSTSIIGVDEKDLSDDIIKTILEKKQDKISPEQGAYLEKILDKREEEKNLSVESLLPTMSKEEIEEKTKEFKVETVRDDIDKRLENTITSMEEFKKMHDVVNEPVEEVSGKQKKLGKISHRAAYVDTVILCLLVQLGIFGLLIFVLLLIK